MSRTVLHALTSRSRTADSSAAVLIPPDGYGDKLLKYVPAETIAFFIPAYGLIKDEPLTLKWVTLVVGVVLTVGYLYLRRDRDQPPRWYFYLLAALAFPAWAVGTTPIGTDLFGMQENLGRYTLLVAVFVIPLVDDLLGQGGS